MKTKKKNIITISLSDKSMKGLLNAGFIDARTKTVRKGMNLSKLMNMLIETHVTVRTYDAAIAYYKLLVKEESLKSIYHQDKMNEYAATIDELEKEKKAKRM